MQNLLWDPPNQTVAHLLPKLCGRLVTHVKFKSQKMPIYIRTHKIVINHVQDLCFYSFFLSTNCVIWNFFFFIVCHLFVIFLFWYFFWNFNWNFMISKHSKNGMNIRIHFYTLFNFTILITDPPGSLPTQKFRCSQQL